MKQGGKEKVQRVCGVVKARITSTDPEVVGSIPTGGVSCRRSVVEHRTENIRAADSRRKDLQSGEGASYFVQRLRVRIPPAVQAAVAQMAELNGARSEGSLCKQFPVW